MLLFLAAAGALASQGDLITAEKRAARWLMGKQVKWRAQESAEVEEQEELPGLQVVQQ